MEMQIKWPVSIWYRFLQKDISKQTIEKNIPEFVLNGDKICMKKFFLTKMNPFMVFFTDFDHKLHDLLLNKSWGLFLSKAPFRDCISYPFNL